MKPITKEWLDRAKEDLDASLAIIPNEHLTNIVAFHSQQAVEKSLKGVIEEFEIGFEKIHNLERLLSVVQKKVQFDVDLNFIKKLDEVYISTRYPSDLGLIPSGKPSMQDAKELYDFAKTLHRIVLKLLEKSDEEGQENDKSKIPQ
jgi:HEPN domain-containing protein